MLAAKLEALRALIRSYGSCLVAYSGGVDSAFLACVVKEVLGDRALAVIADSPSLPRRELADALSLGEKFGFPVRVIRTHEFDNPLYLQNPVNRCYFCKQELFQELVPIAQKEGFAVIVYGENQSDIGDHRPGSRAAAEQQVRAPLKEVGLTKDEIRQLSAEMGLPTADKPQLACLSSRIPHGEKVTVGKLGMIEKAENVLRDMGFYDVRVRHHELGPGPDGQQRSLARIELGALSEALGLNTFGVINQRLRALGYSFVTLDLNGYRRPSAPAEPQLPSRRTADNTELFPQDGLSN